MTNNKKKRESTYYKHFFFDLDGTVTRSRSLIEKEMRQVLAQYLNNERTITIVSGAQTLQIQKQIDNLPCYYLGQNGNHAFHGADQKDIWRRLLSPEQKKEILDHVKSIPRDWPVQNENDLVEDRGCQISYSLIGHHEDVSKKEAFDSDFAKRRNLIQKYPFESKTVDVKIGGTTCFDYFERGKNKGYNVAEFISLMNWDKNQCIYLGDALFPGGNDETVMGVIETFAVNNPTDTLNFLKKQLYSPLEGPEDYMPSSTQE